MAATTSHMALICSPRCKATVARARAPRSATKVQIRMRAILGMEFRDCRRWRYCGQSAAAAQSAREAHTALGRTKMHHLVLILLFRSQCFDAAVCPVRPPIRPVQRELLRRKSIPLEEQVMKVGVLTGGGD